MSYLWIKRSLINVAVVTCIQHGSPLWFLVHLLNSKLSEDEKLIFNHLASPETNIVLTVLAVLINICLMAENIPSLH